MRVHIAFASLLGVASAKSVAQPPQQHVFSNPIIHDEDFHFPTVRESVAMARKIMHLTTIGDLVTVFPKSSGGSDEASINAPSDIGGSPIGLMEYYADCDPYSGNPVLLGITFATPFRNYAAGSNISLSIRWWPDRRKTYAIFSEDDAEIPTPHTPAALPRFSLHGHLEPLAQDKHEKVKACFLRSHPDSIYWQPGSDIHESHYVQLVVEHVYWFGGFGDRARIQWLPIEEWRNFTMQEIMNAKLPGEKSRKSWLKSWFGTDHGML